MQVAIQIPDDFAQRLQARWGNLSQGALEALAVEAYREELLTTAEIGRMLGHESRWQTDEFLKEKQAYLHYTESELVEDRAAIAQLIDR